MKITRDQAFEILADKMDERNLILQQVRIMHETTGKIPDNCQDILTVGLKDNWKSWRDMPKVVKRIKQAAKMAAKNPGIAKMNYVAQVKYLKEGL